MVSTRPPRATWRRTAVFHFFLLLAAVASLPAQSFNATDLHQPADLDGTWLVHAGDDPAFAQPGFDDSHWTPFDVHKFITTIFRDTHPPVVWYRLHVKVDPAQTDLALLEHQISSAFEVYVNGARLISAGSIEPFVPHTYSARLLAPIPAQDVRTGTLVIALRVHISPYDWSNTGPGYAASNLFLGHEAALRDHTWLTVIGDQAVSCVIGLAGFALGIVALSLFSSQPAHREYLWIFLQFFVIALALPITWYETFHTLPLVWDQVKLLLQFGSNFFAILMYFSMIRMRMAGWMRIFFVVSFLGSFVLVFGYIGGLLSAVVAQTALLPLAFFAFGLLPFLLLREWRRGNMEAGILLIPLLLAGFAVYFQIVLFVLLQFPATVALALRLAVLSSAWQIGPFSLSPLSMVNVLMLLSLTIIIVLRATRVSRQQALLEGELAAAREVQQVILPEAIEPVPGFRIESVYQPAQQVGGDFFQILPTRDNGLLLVIGDVAGKGLPAAMLVSVLVGAVRAVAEYTNDPAELLANLNDRLVGRAAGGFSTALAARFYRHGTVAIANAGHLPPYLDGHELATPGELPLGVTSGTRYTITEFHLQPGSRITFLSDGVVEAQNAKGELLGFEKSLALSTEPAQAIVAAARGFGQHDDITVVAIQRISADPPVAASATTRAVQPSSAQ
ncbi:hypothetical protein DYQ86_16675 [Acidobacteria bacterium AB60]|nr:hypothetical protein DYQ86_16675 [Acidobacteria bacterium AB60]